VRSFDVPSLRILFEKIMAMQYQEHNFVAPYLKDCLLKIKLLPSSSPLTKIARQALYPGHPLWILRKITNVSQEEFRKWVYELRDNNPKLLNDLLPHLVEGLEVNMVFKKPI